MKPCGPYTARWRLLTTTVYQHRAVCSTTSVWGWAELHDELSFSLSRAGSKAGNSTLSSLDPTSGPHPAPQRLSKAPSRRPKNFGGVSGSLGKSLGSCPAQGGGFWAGFCRRRVPGVSSHDARHSYRARPIWRGLGVRGVVDTTGGARGAQCARDGRPAGPAEPAGFQFRARSPLIRSPLVDAVLVEQFADVYPCLLGSSPVFVALGQLGRPGRSRRRTSRD